MKGVPQGGYTKEFREESVKLIIEEGLSLPDAARRLSLPPSTLGNWVRARKEGKLIAIGATQKPLTDAETELKTATPLYNLIYVPDAHGIAKRLLRMVQS